MANSPLNKQESESLIIDTKTVKGKITDESGSPIPGVNILIKGTNKGVSSNIDGTYNLSVSDDNVILAFSFVGFITQEVLVGNRSMINISLVSENKALSEVVVVGYGTARAKDLTGAVATINQNTIKDLPVSTVDQKMIGQVAGMQIQQLSGQPGAGTSIRIRGMLSIIGDLERIGDIYYQMSKSFERKFNFFCTSGKG